GLVRKFLASDEFSRVQGELLSLAANTSFERGLRMHRTPEEFAAVLKKISQFVPGAQNRLIEAANVPAPKDTRTSPHVMKDSTVVPVSSSLELPSKADPSFSAAVPEQKEE
ncbi:hypothetical protein Tco_1099926, partial [Tanacetum coccineum]